METNAVVLVSRIATWAVTEAAGLFAQSLLLIAAGMSAARLLRARGAAAQSAILRLTLLAVMLCPLLALGLAGAGIRGYTLPLRIPQAFVVAAAQPGAPGDSLPTGEIDKLLRAGLEASPSGAAAHGVTQAQGQGNNNAAGVETRRRLAGKEPANRGKKSQPGAAVPQNVALISMLQTMPPYTIFALALAAAWLIAAIFFLARLALAYGRIARLRRRATTAPAPLLSECRGLARQMGVRPPAVLVSPRVHSPCLVGFLRPAILLPRNEEEPSESALRTVLVHELAHLARRDCFWNLLGWLARAVFCFQPLLWRLARRIEETSEEVADDCVVQAGLDRQLYARRLFEIAERYQPGGAELAAGVGVIAFPSTLGRRVQRIMDPTRVLSTRAGGRFALLTGAAALPVILLVALCGFDCAAARVAGAPETKNASPSVAAPVTNASGEEANNPGGVYLINGGLGCLEVRGEPEHYSNIEYVFPAEFPDYTQLVDWVNWLSSGPERKSLERHYRMRNGLLTIEVKLPEIVPGFNRDYSFTVICELRPSDKTRGDWDLIRYRPPYDSANLRPVSPPIPFFLHRMDDARAREYFIVQHEKKDAAKALELAAVLAHARPDDPFVATIQMEAYLKKGDFAGLTKEADAWRDRFQNSDNAYLRRVIGYADNILRTQHWDVAGRNAFRPMLDLLGRQTNLEQRMKKFPELLAFNEFSVPLTELNPLLIRIENLLEAQISSKVLSVEAMFMMLRGERASALQTLCAAYQMGNLMLVDRQLIRRLVGIAVKSISLRGLEVYALNCCQTQADFTALWEHLDKFERSLQPLTDEELYFFNSPLEWQWPEDLNRSYQEAKVRAKIADTRLELLRAATAARYHLVLQNSFPKTEADFAPLLPHGLPADPFGSGPLKFTGDEREMSVYSVGPDGQDGGAQVSYDPTNGTISAGDLFSRIPRQRTYPFPREGERADNAAGLLRDFPNGLPLDPFADFRGRPLSILDATTTEPLTVFSFGPDADEFEIGNPCANGAKVVAPIGVPATPGLTAQRVYRRAATLPREPETDFPSPGHPDRLVPEGPYDPTNGTTSRGDLSLTLPGK